MAFSAAQKHRLLCFIYLTFHLLCGQSCSDSGLSRPVADSLSVQRSDIKLTWHSNSHIFLQQTTRDTKRRASKETGALCKDGQPVSINTGGEAAPGDVCDERWRKAKTLRRGRWPDLWKVHQKTGWWFTQVCGWSLLGTWFITTQAPA